MAVINFTKMRIFVKNVLRCLKYLCLLALTAINAVIIYYHIKDIYITFHTTVVARFTELNSGWLYQSEKFYLVYMITLIIISCLLIIFSFIKINRQPIIAFSAQFIPILYFIVDALTNFTQQ